MGSSLYRSSLSGVSLGVASAAAPPVTVLVGDACCDAAAGVGVSGGVCNGENGRCMFVGVCDIAGGDNRYASRARVYSGVVVSRMGVESAAGDCRSGHLTRLGIVVDSMVRRVLIVAVSPCGNSDNAAIVDMVSGVRCTSFSRFLLDGVLGLPRCSAPDGGFKLSAIASGSPLRSTGMTVEAGSILVMPACSVVVLLTVPLLGVSEPPLCSAGLPVEAVEITRLGVELPIDSTEVVETDGGFKLSAGASGSPLRLTGMTVEAGSILVMLACSAVVLLSVLPAGESPLCSTGLTVEAGVEAGVALVLLTCPAAVLMLTLPVGVLFLAAGRVADWGSYRVGGAGTTGPARAAMDDKALGNWCDRRGVLEGVVRPSLVGGW